MKFPQDQIDELKKIFPEVSIYEEGGYTFFLIPNFELPKGCIPEKTDVLLCPMQRDGYSSRLFFSEKVQSCKTLNWNANGVRILERNWYAFSWRVQPNLRIAQMIVSHIRGLG